MADVVKDVEQKSMTLGEYIKEATAFEYSKDYFDIVKEAGELQLMAICLDGYNYMAECVEFDIDVHESVVAVFDESVFTEAPKVEEFKKMVRDKADKFVSDVKATGGRIKKMAEDFYQRAIGLLKRVVEFLMRPFNALSSMIKSFMDRFTASGKRSAAMELLKRIESMTPSKELGEKWGKVAEDIKSKHEEYDVSHGFWSHAGRSVKDVFTSMGGLKGAFRVVRQSMNLAGVAQDKIEVIRDVFINCASDSFYLPSSALVLVKRSAFAGSIKKLSEMEVADLYDKSKMESLLSELDDDLQAVKRGDSNKPEAVPFSALENSQKEFSNRVSQCKTILSKLNKAAKNMDAKQDIATSDRGKLSSFIGKTSELLAFLQKNVGEMVKSIDASFKRVTLAHSLAGKIAKVSA